MITQEQLERAMAIAEEHGLVDEGSDQSVWNAMLTVIDEFNGTVDTQSIEQARQTLVEAGVVGGCIPMYDYYLVWNAIQEILKGVR